jgi:hypothetical protein
MRAVTLIAGVLLAATGAAQPADLPPDRNIGLHYPALGRRVAPLVIYDYQPGVVVRAYLDRAVAQPPLLPDNGRGAGRRP